MILNKRPNDKVAVALVLCFCVLAIASIFTMRSSFEQLKVEKQSNLNIAKENKSENLEKNVVNPVPTVDSQSSNEGNKSEAKTEGAIINYILPVDGTVTVGYSKDEPVYSMTLDQYVIHTGIDFEAPADTNVVAIADGTVTKAYTDDKLGLTIEILHPEGITSKYCNLNSTKEVGIGDVVKQGDIISGIGNSSLFESVDPPHLHFEIIKDGKSINPAEYIKLN
ncbi:M23 family metallopeptidase [Anaerovorax odorimutans]|uniref:M23 family metallopeptidase n=1 Tax=Anaerovorax odorimutans TaxID=109327 RepID=UPI000426772D|nr:M23 family metallopeptidase [Anaerovorax odorimutans]